MKSRAKVLIADDHDIVIAGVKSILREYPEFEVVGEATDGLEAVELTRRLRPDIVIMDISMPNLDGIEATRRIKASNAAIRIVVYTMHSDKEFVVDLFRAGISAYVMKEDPASDLIRALQAVERGATYFSTMAPTILVRHMKELEQQATHEDGYDRLSPREREVFRFLSEGKAVRDVAGILSVSPKTVESHKYSIMQKLNITSVTDMVKIAIRKSLINP